MPLEVFKPYKFNVRFWISIFSSLGFDDRLSGYLTADVDENAFASTGFRWDF